MKAFLTFLPLVFVVVFFRKKQKSDHDMIVEDMNEFLSKWIGVIEENSANGDGVMDRIITLKKQASCDACKKRKKRCDGLKPCFTCMYRRLQCTYSQVPSS